MRRKKVVLCLPITVNIDLRQCAIVKSVVMQGDDGFPASPSTRLEHFSITSTHSGFEIRTYGVESIQQREIPCRRPNSLRTPVMRANTSDESTERLQKILRWQHWSQGIVRDLKNEIGAEICPAIIFKSRDSWATTIVKTKPYRESRFATKLNYIVSKP